VNQRYDVVAVATVQRLNNIIYRKWDEPKRRGKKLIKPIVIIIYPDLSYNP